MTFYKRCYARTPRRAPRPGTPDRWLALSVVRDTTDAHGRTSGHARVRAPPGRTDQAVVLLREQALDFRGPAACRLADAAPLPAGGGPPRVSLRRVTGGEASGQPVFYRRLAPPSLGLTLTRPDQVSAPFSPPGAVGGTAAVPSASVCSPSTTARRALWGGVLAPAIARHQQPFPGAWSLR